MHHYFAKHPHCHRQIRAYQDLPGGPGGPFKGWLKVARLARPSWREAAVGELQGLALGDRFWREGGSIGPVCG
jgi:hypothetical protein